MQDSHDHGKPARRIEEDIADWLLLWLNYVCFPRFAGSRQGALPRIKLTKTKKRLRKGAS